MSKGILLGILLQCISATGYMVIVNVTSIKNEWFRTGLMIFFAGMVALIVAGYTVISGKQELSAIQPKEYIYIAIGSIMVMFVAQVIFSSVTFRLKSPIRNGVQTSPMFGHTLAGPICLSSKTCSRATLWPIISAQEMMLLWSPPLSNRLDKKKWSLQELYSTVTRDSNIALTAIMS